MIWGQDDGERDFDRMMGDGMGVECDLCVAGVDRERFYAIDYQVMRHAFDIHNQLGRFCDERIYQEELLNRCRASGLAAEREVRLRVSYGSFTKCYYMDIVIENGVVYELKTTDDLSNKHKSQLINYLLLVGLNYGKVINFRPSSVDSWFVTTTLSPQKRALFHVDDQQWIANDDADRQVRDVFCELLHEWGAYLDFCLYKEALLHFTQGPDAGLLPVKIKMDGRDIGMQNMCLLNPKTAWTITAIHDQIENYGTHFKRLLSHTELEKLHWFNLNKKDITLKTLTHDPVPKSSCQISRHDPVPKSSCQISPHDPVIKSSCQISPHDPVIKSSCPPSPSPHDPVIKSSCQISPHDPVPKSSCQQPAPLEP